MLARARSRRKAARPTAAFEEKSRAAAWKTTPSWYLIAATDLVIAPEAQQFMARRAGARTAEIRASHAIALTQPAAVAGQIAAAARARDKQSRP
jgi:pimeloyl-ACP methyl ester carboxylesterase